jgi:2-methylisocitrate lyase-like PEP mutase family enzyme
MAYQTSLRERLEDDEIVTAPGIHDSLTARAAEMVGGFDAVYMTGHGASLSMTGYPDAGLVTMTEQVQNARNIQQTTSIPVIADADTGYGNATNVIRTVRKFAHTGVAAIQLEDQVEPKRCGHVGGRQIISKEEAVGKYRAAAETRDETNPEMLIIARTDARGAQDGSLSEAIDRVKAYLEAGADVAFVESPTDVDELEQIGAAIDAPLLYNCVGISPKIEPEELETLGFDIVIYPIATTRAAIAASIEHLQEIRERGTQAEVDMDQCFDDLPFDTKFQDEALRKFFEFGGFPQIYDWERQYLPDEDMEKYEDALGEDISAED